MATIDLGKIKQVWRGTYNNSTAYVVDDLVSFTDSGITSTYICVANSTGNNPSSSGTAHASWNYVAKGVADPIPSQSGNAGKVLKTDGSSLSFGTGGGLVLITQGTVGSNVSSFTVDNCFTTDYDYYKLVYMYGGESWMKMRYVNSDGSINSAAGYYFAGSWYRRDAGGSHDVGQFGYYNQNFCPLGYFDGQTYQPSFGEFNFLDPKNSSYRTQYWGSCASKHGNHTKRTDLVGSYDAAAEVRGFQFLVDSGSHPMTTSNFHFRLYGMA